MITRVAVDLHQGRHRTRLVAGLLRAQQVHGPADRCRIGLLATTALLLGGDQVQLEVEVGPGATVELFDVAGTVAYHGRGRPCSWRVRLVLHEGARLRWSGEPLVVSDGADVRRALELDLAQGAGAWVRETVALGRRGEVGGALRSATTVQRDGEEVFVDDLLLEPSGHRRLPGMLGAHRVLDTVLAFGLPAPDQVDGAYRYTLAAPDSTVTRYLGAELAASPLHRAWDALRLPGAVPTGTGSR